MDLEWGSFSPVTGESKEAASQDAISRKHVCWSWLGRGGTGSWDRLSPQGLLVASTHPPQSLDMTVELPTVLL